GIDGQIKYMYDRNTEVDRSQGWDFREVMRIPTVQNGEKLAFLIPSTKGVNGRTVYDKEITAIPGKPYLMKTGTNVSFNQADQTFYATAEGHVSFGNKAIHV